MLLFSVAFSLWASNLADFERFEPLVLNKSAIQREFAEQFQFSSCLHLGREGETMSFPLSVRLRVQVRLLPTIVTTTAFAATVGLVSTTASTTVSAASLASLGADGGDVVETSHRRSVTLSPYWATVEDVHTFALSTPASKASAQAWYEFELPAGAVVTGLSVKIAGVENRATTVDSIAAITAVPADVAAAPDLALLRAVKGTVGGIMSYQLVLFPVAARRELVASISWAMPTRFESSRVSVTIPGRASGFSLAKTEVQAVTQGSDGVSVRQLLIGGKRPPATMPGSADLLLEATAVFSRPGLSLAASSFTLDKNLHALTIRLAAPESPSSALAKFAELVVVVDGSRSIRREGLGAAAAIVAELLAALPRKTKVNVVFSSRTSRSIFLKLNRNTLEARAAVASAFANLRLRNGSKLVDGLALAAEQLTVAERAENGQRGLVVISDGHFGQDRIAIGDVEKALINKRATVFSVELESAGPSVADPLSDFGLRGVTNQATSGALKNAIDASGGRVFVVSPTRAKKQARAIVSRIRPRAAVVIRDILVDGDQVWLGQPTPVRLARGSGATGTMLWTGRRPPTLQINALVDGKPRVLRSRATPGSKTAVDAAAALAFFDQDEEIEGKGVTSLTIAERLGIFSRAAINVGLVSPEFALVIPAPGNQFGRERLAFAARWGGQLYRRALPPHGLGKKLALALPGTFARKTAHRRLPRGGIDKTAMGTRIRKHMYRKVRYCYERALRTNTRLEGRLIVSFEIHRDEVVKASVGGMFDQPRLRKCVTNAAYDLKIVVAKADANTTFRVRYPFRLRRSKNGVSKVEVDKSSGVLDPDDPLSGID